VSVRLAGLSVMILCAAAQAVQDRPIGFTLSLDRDGRGALAVLRRDGLMFPFASFDRDTWTVPWPVDVRTLEIPTTIDTIPRRWWGHGNPAGWRAHLSSGEPVALEMRRPVLQSAFCSRRLWVSTSYQSALEMPPSPIDPFPKDGLAISGGVPLEPIETVAPSAAEWGKLAVDLLDDFNRAEDQTVGGVRSNTGWRHPIPSSTRHRVPVRLESWYRSPSGEPGWAVSYIESVRAYAPRPEDNGCGLETLVSGWLHHQDGVFKKATGLIAKLTYCDRVGATYMLPFGRIRPKEKIYWVFQLSGWESEWYDVVEVGRQRARYVVEVPAGTRTGCF
jgi:hypothetical protein